MEPEITSLIATTINQSATAALAIFSIWMLARSYKDRIEEKKSHKEQITSLTTEVIEVVKANTAAMTQLCERMKSRGLSK